jgi:MOSC domain-containing protein YiiM
LVDSTIRLLSINIGTAEPIGLGARVVPTGIRKRPVTSARLECEGLVGDTIADQVHHGGHDQALYVYAATDLEWWEQQLGRRLPPGTFGDNLTFSSFPSRGVRIGDRFRIGAVQLQATAARIACGVFATWIGEENWVKRFSDARRPGFYARVLKPGTITSGQLVEPLGGGDAHPTIATLMDVWYQRAPDPDTLEALLASPLSARARAALDRKRIRRAA